MKVYISTPSQLVSKRMLLFFFGPFLLVISFALFFYVKPLQSNQNDNVIWVSLYMLCMSFILFYQAIIPNVLAIENDRIILKGALKEVTYEFKDFKEVNKKDWRGCYGIFFTDGKSFEFYPRFNLWYYFSTSQQEKIVDLNNQINNIIKEHTNKN